MNEEQLERLKVEYSELQEKMIKLDSFLGSDDFMSLLSHEAGLLTVQYTIMSSYLAVLMTRLAMNGDTNE